MLLIFFFHNFFYRLKSIDAHYNWIKSIYTHWWNDRWLGWKRARILGPLEHGVSPLEMYPQGTWKIMSLMPSCCALATMPIKISRILKVSMNSNISKSACIWYMIFIIIYNYNKFNKQTRRYHIAYLSNTSHNSDWKRFRPSL